MIAPTGTIGFMMDCDTTGIEPDLALVKYKKLVGGGVIKIVNNTVPAALIKLGYSPEQVEAIVSHIDSTGTIEGAPGAEDRSISPVFDCSFRPQNGTRSIHYMGHLKMMGAVQPFVSGAISKTINMPEECIGGRHHGGLHRELAAGPQSGRDLSRQFEEGSADEYRARARRPRRRPPLALRRKWSRPPRRWFTGRCGASWPTSGNRSRISFRSAATKGTSRSGCTTMGQPGEIFVTMAKEGSTISGLMDSFATSVSYCLQYGVPLKFLVDKFGHVRFEPSGWTGNQADSVCEVDSGLYFPVAGGEVPGRRVQRRERSGRVDDAAGDGGESAGDVAVPGGGHAMRRCARSAAG